MEKPGEIFCNGRYSVLNYYCCAEFLAYYALENKSSKTCEYQPDKFDDNLIENNHKQCSYRKKIKLKTGETMRCHRRIL